MIEIPMKLINEGQVSVPKMVMEKYNSMGPIPSAKNVRGSLKLDSMQVTIDGRGSFNSQARACRINANKTTATDSPASCTNELADQQTHLQPANDPADIRNVGNGEFNTRDNHHSTEDPKQILSCKKLLNIIHPTCNPCTRRNRLAAADSDTLKLMSYAQCGSTCKRPPEHSNRIFKGTTANHIPLLILQSCQCFVQSSASSSLLFCTPLSMRFAVRISIALVQVELSGLHIIDI
jgi:hypothetical protein